MSLLTLLLLAASTAVQAALQASEYVSRLTMFNDRLTVSVNKSTGAIDILTLDGQDLLGTPSSSNPAIGPYLDCYCTTTGNGAYTPGRIDPKYQLLTSASSTGDDGLA